MALSTERSECKREEVQRGTGGGGKDCEAKIVKISPRIPATTKSQRREKREKREERL